MRPVAPHLNLKSFCPSGVQVLWTTRFPWKMETIWFLIQHCVTPHTQHLSILIGSRKISTCVTTSTPCECVSHTWAVPSPPSHQRCVISVPNYRQLLCWYQVRPGFTLISQALGLYSACFCLVLPCPLSFCRAGSTIHEEPPPFFLLPLQPVPLLWINMFILLIEIQT